MKKLISLLLVVLMVMSTFGCGKKSNLDENNVKLNDTTNFIFNDSSEITTMDYVITALAADHEWNVNFVDGLVEADSHGAYVGSIAESWEANEDATVWTFHLRDGVKWVTNTGEEYADVTAQDFVTGLRHAAEFASGTGTVLFGTIKGFQQYYTAHDWSDEAWANVGIEAVDDKTLVYTLEVPVPYFYTVVEYTCCYPINKQFLESRGEGCKLGSPDKSTCSFGNVSADSILYCGGYILDVYDVKSQIVIKKNNAYWDAKNVFVPTITSIYDDGSDPYSVMKGFEQGVNAAAGLNASWEDFAAYKEKYNNYLTVSLPNAYAFGVVFNYNRQVWDYTNYATDEAARANTHKAILNENFRKALRASYDVLAYLSTTSDPMVAEGTLRNMNGVYNLVAKSDGTQYGALVEKELAALGTKVSLQDGQWPWLNKEEALKYIEAAKAEGIEFPVHLDMLVIETSDAQVKRGQSFKNSVAENTDGQIIIELVLSPIDDVYNIAYYNEDPAGADYDISTFTGWGPDYVDPKTFTQIYSPTEGYYMTACGLTSIDATPDRLGEDDDIKHAIGLDEYEALYKAADAITGDLDARYEAYAKADAYFLQHALYIPTSMQTRALRVTHVVPFTAPYSTGVSQYKYKNMKLQEDIVTADQYNTAKAKWEKGE